MNTAFTLCSINYLAQAKNLLDSMRQSNPEWRFIVGLVDKNTSNVDLSFLGCEIVEVDKIGINGFDDMVNSYSIVEFITAVKPFYFTYFLEKHPEIDKLVYFDPDIMVLASLAGLEKKLDESDIILTPHFTQPIQDSYLPTEKHVFSTGVFNLGFLAVKRSPNTLNMLKWWETKLRSECLLDLSRGYFVDQLWMNLVPAYFEKVLIDKYPGYNMAHWNLHERVITETAEGYLANKVPLVFFHFSHFHPGKPDEIAAYHNRYSFEKRPDLKKLFRTYTDGLLKNKYFELKKVPCYYMRNEGRKKLNTRFKAFLRKKVPLSLKIKLSKLVKKR
jgi:hypothetical protein